MELNGPSRFRQSKITSSDRFLGTFPLSSPPSDRPSSSTIDELSEDDVFYSSDFSSDPIESNAVHQNRQPYQTFTPSSFSSPNFQQNPKSFSNSQNFGILAALRDPSRPQSNFYQKPSISTPSSSASSGTSPSSSRLIPSIPKPPQERIPVSSSLGRHHQSAPVNVPLLKQTMWKQRQFDEDFDEEEEEQGEMVPPHVLAARSVAESPALAHSVLEGVGRTLKGRDLRQVRNAIWRQTGFLD